MPRVCDLEPFVAESTPQPGSLEEASTAGELFQQQVQAYLIRMREAMCADLEELETQVADLEVRVTTLEGP